ncbi:Hypothetical protein, putative [Bodo saltans]|uniref:Uncharacterized protein n=1 Tax=Bodo saltans TaxID=75058 RepID=A0A0S4JG29_BODSA|nr:Hypothetical protein, putative [Bodo saltans]|eukprot:CUG88375.1 Hypothetical protein, putative [Bodo saltans]
MNAFASPSIVALMHRASWTSINGDYALKYICHVEHGLRVIVTNFSTLSFVGTLGITQMLESVHASSPGFQFDGKELLRVVDEGCRLGNVSFTLQSAASPDVGVLTVNVVVGVIAGHHLHAAVKLECVHISGRSASRLEQQDAQAAEFIKEMVVRPLLVQQTILERLLQTLVDQRRVSSDDLALIVRGCVAVPPSAILMPSTTTPESWQQELRLRCFPSEEPPRHAQPSHVVPPTGAAANSSPAIATRSDTYVESPEEAHRKRQREEARTRVADPKDDATANLKKIRKALR